MTAGERLKTEDRRLKTARELTAKSAKRIKNKGCLDKARLRDVSIFISKGTTPSTVGCRFVSEGINYVKSESIGNSKYLDSTIFEHITAETDEKLKRSRLREGDLLFSIAGAYLGKLALVSNNDVPANTNQAVGIVRLNRKMADEHFAYYYFSQGCINAYINKQSAQSSQPNLNLALLGDLPFSDYPLVHQQKIAAVLSALDAKIELNNRVNAELEAMAKTLYDYWFVQFDFPFDFAKGKPAPNGRPYKTSGGKMVYNPTLKRKIPEGWNVTTVGETFRTTLGGTPSRKKPSYWEPPLICWLNSEDKGTLFVVNADEYISKEGLKNSAAKLLPAGTVILSIVRHLRGSILGIEAATNQSVVGIEETTNISSSYIYPLILREIPRYMTQRTGAQQPHINKEAVDETIIVLPDDTALQLYQTLAAPLFNTIKTNSFQTQQLTALRDWLLPMLMNGQVQVE